MTVSQAISQYFGGKWEQADWIIQHFCDHHTYVEAYGGMGSVLLQKEPSAVEVYNDKDRLLTNFMAILRNPALREILMQQLALTPYHRGEYWDAVVTMERTVDPIERARLYYQVMRQSISGAPGRAWSKQKTHSRRGMASGNSRWLSGIAGLADAGDRLAQVQIECADALHVIRDYDAPRTLFYLDPVYTPDTCQQGVYRCGMTLDDHVALMDVLQTVKGKVVLSGYANELYDTRLADWKRVERTVPCRSNVNTRGGTAGKPTRVEVLWIKE